MRGSKGDTGCDGDQQNGMSCIHYGSSFLLSACAKAVTNKTVMISAGRRKLPEPKMNRQIMPARSPVTAQGRRL